MNQSIQKFNLIYQRFVVKGFVSFYNLINLLQLDWLVLTDLKKLGKRLGA